MISSQWIQEIAQELNLSPLNSNSCQLTSATIETDVKRIIETAFKLSKRAKKTKLTIDDLNLALSLHHKEHIYGLTSTSTISTNSNGEIINEDVKVNLADYISKPISVPCPQNVDINLHWLAIEGTQPRIPENPELVYYDAAADTSSLPREMAYFYSRVTEALLSGDIKSVATVCNLLSDDSGINDLCGYFSRFIFVHIRRNLRNITILLSLLRSIESLASNPHVNLEPCLHQILPSVLTCVVASRLGSGSSASDHSNYTSSSSSSNFYGLQDQSISSWGGTHYDVRLYAAKVVSILAKNYSESYPDLLPRVCKTYLEAIDTIESSNSESMSENNNSNSNNTNNNNNNNNNNTLNYSVKSIGTVYGGIVGLGMLGERVISSVLLPNFPLILKSLSCLSLSSLSSSSNGINDTNNFPSTTIRIEPVLKKQRTSNTRYSNDDSEEMSIQTSGFVDQINERYIVPSYTNTSLSLTESLPYIQMIQQQNKLALNGEINNNIQGRGLCEYALMNILGWYIVKSLSSSTKLRDSVLYPNTLKNSKKNSQKSRFKKSNNQFSTSSTRISTSTSSLNDDTSSNQIETDWASFIDQRGELFVPYYVSVSQDLDYCNLWI